MSTTDDSPSETNDRTSALFRTLVAQQVNMALVCLGQAPDETGKKHLDLEAARFFIDVLEMLEVKTKGNLAKPEQDVLAQSLTSLRLAYVQISNAAASTSSTQPAPEQTSAEPAPGPSETPPEAESRKKYTKKY